MNPAETLSIIIPAFNEETAIRETVRAVLDAREEICAAAGLNDVEVIVVSDGSSDRTVERIRDFEGVRLVVWKENRGYGAAIKRGFREARGDFLGFMDADGTCSPSFFADLVGVMQSARADIVVGSRLHRESRMPAIRRIGNVFFARLLSLLSGTCVRDSATGMRLLKRSCLDWIDVLPDGLDFTPAMSALASFSRGVRIAEVPMPYEERQGESKLNVVADGLRFLRIIVGTAYTYVPFRFFMIAGLLALVAGAGLGLPVLAGYLRSGRIEDWQFYRIMSVVTLGNVGLAALLVGMLSANFSRLILPDCRRPGKVFRGVNRLLVRGSLVVGVGAILVAFGLVFPGLNSYAATGRVTIHWSFVTTALLFVGTGCNLILFSFMFKLQALLERRIRSVPGICEAKTNPSGTADFE